MNRAALLIAFPISFLACSGARADYALICTNNLGAPTSVGVPGAGSFIDACGSVASRGFASCIDAQGQNGMCPPMSAGMGQSLDQVADNAATSACAQYSWRKRGVAPVGYIRGMAMSYARHYCQAKVLRTGISGAIAQPLGDASTDALAWYAANGATMSFANGASMSSSLRDVYVLAMGEGMFESSGNPTVGWDRTATDQAAEKAEAGLFQVSFDSFNLSPWFRELWTYYHANPAECRADVFMRGSTDQGDSEYGDGDAALFQSFTKQCPAFAVDYALIMFRVDRQHFGPINTLKAEFRGECGSMFADIENSVTCPP